MTVVNKKWVYCDILVFVFCVSLSRPVGAALLEYSTLPVGGDEFSMLIIGDTLLSASSGSVNRVSAQDIWHRRLPLFILSSSSG